MKRHVWKVLSTIALGLALTGPATAQQVVEHVQGTVTDGFGTPVEAARLTLQSISGYQLSQETDGNGAFRFQTVVAGTYELTVTQPGFQTAQREIQARTAPVDLTIVLIPNSPATITVTATDPQGLVLPGVTVQLRNPAGTVIEGVTDPDGEFRTGPVQPGTWTVDGSLAGFQPVQAVVQTAYGVDARATTRLGLDYSVAENLVVLGSSRPVGRRTEVRLIDSPVTTTVIRGETLAAQPAVNLGNALRAVPGVNVVQFSARDVQVTTRQSTGILSNSQLVLMDGRSIYLDFFGMVLWDSLSVGPDDIEQVEVVRGPSSVTWGPNAMTGAVHFITKPPRESVGTTVTMGAGWADRNAGSRTGSGPGLIAGSHVSIRRAPTDTLAYRISAGYSRAPALPRPVGRIPVVPAPFKPGQTVGGAWYPPDQPHGLGRGFVNRGTAQPKFDVRVDQELGNQGQLTYSGGIGTTEGVTHTGVGPFHLERGSYMGYGKVGYTQGDLRLQVFTNIADGNAPSLLLEDPYRTGQPVSFGFHNRTIDVDAGHSRLVAGSHLLSYGANVRHNTFRLNIAPEAPNRLEYGGYLQDEIFLGHFRLTAGGRLDKFGSVRTPFFSPRLSVMYKPGDNHSIVASYNQAFRSPSVIENFLQLTMLQPIDLSQLQALRPLLPLFVPPGLDEDASAQALADLQTKLAQTTSQPFPLAIGVIGNNVPIAGRPTEPLGAESMTAYELRYTGSFGRATSIGAAAYVNQGHQSILGVPVPPEFDPYTPDNPPPGWLLPPELLGYPGSAGIHLPRTGSAFRNRGGTRNLGLELWLDQGVSASMAMRASYSWQAPPTIRNQSRPYDNNQLSQAPDHRFSTELSFNDRRFLGNLLVTSATRAFWADVLTPDYHGYSPGYLSVDGSLGLKWKNGTVITSVKVTNLLNRSIQQHVFGDILRRTVLAELRLAL